MNLIDALRKKLLKGNLITTRMIRKEYALRHAKNDEEMQRIYEGCTIRSEDFPVEDLMLSLDDFTRKQGWM